MEEKESYQINTSSESYDGYISDSLESGSFIEDSEESEPYISDAYSNPNYNTNSNVNLLTNRTKHNPEKLVTVKNKKLKYGASDLANMRSEQSFISIRKSLISNFESRDPGKCMSRLSHLSQTSRFSKASRLSKTSRFSKMSQHSILSTKDRKRSNQAKKLQSYNDDQMEKMMVDGYGENELNFGEGVEMERSYYSTTSVFGEGGAECATLRACCTIM